MLPGTHQACRRVTAPCTEWTKHGHIKAIYGSRTDVVCNGTAAAWPNMFRAWALGQMKDMVMVMLPSFYPQPSFSCFDFVALFSTLGNRTLLYWCPSVSGASWCFPARGVLSRLCTVFIFGKGRHTALSYLTKAANARLTFSGLSCTRKWCRFFAKRHFAKVLPGVQSWLIAFTSPG